MLEKGVTMISESADCAWEPLSRWERLPCDRFKHATALHNGFVYIHGGRQDSALGDFWRYNIALDQWERLPCGRLAPEKLEGHSMVAYQDVLYVFGGMVDFGANKENTPLWMYAIDSRKWFGFQSLSSQESRPSNRKGHSAVVYRSAMFIYGGYFDIEGAVEEFWAFYFDTQKWSALSPRTRGLGPGPRHGHSSATHNSTMYLFGGLRNMAEQNDFWSFDFRRHNWSNIKTSSGPPKLVGHASIIHQGCLWVIGGGLPSRSPTSNIWKYDFTSRSWKRISRGKDHHDCAKMYHCVIPLGWDSLTGSSDSGLDRSSEIEQPNKLLSFPSWGANKVASIPTSDLIEMKSMKDRSTSPLFCSCSSSADHTDEHHLLTPYENECFTYSGEETEADDCQMDSADRPMKENVFMVIGGKPLSRNCEISVSHIKLE
ncbi:kelch domain-containing protein 10-like [Pyxicephalus adspersus]|uniref:kelch domain-containing protein 10-like n=1 Tax=Pyxicephalus adspersus TaxID=30357 RepID=UPI003B5AA25A